MSVDALLALLALLVLLSLLLLPVRWGFVGIFRHHATGSMLRGVLDSCRRSEGSGFAFVDPKNHRPRNRRES